MGVFKENARAFENVLMKQTRIYTDACDAGYPYNIKNVPEDIKQLFHYINDLKGTSLIHSRVERNDGVDVVVRIAWEVDEGFECGTEYRISLQANGKAHSRIDTNCDAYVSVICEPYRVPYKRR